MKLISFFKKVKTQSDKISEDLAVSVTKKLVEDKVLSESIANKVVVSLGPVIEKAIKEAIELEFKNSKTEV